jgi:molybdenum cofactor cytidylyltransferase
MVEIVIQRAVKKFRDNRWPIAPGCTALIGAGGKTTTMLSMAKAVADEGGQVLITTTTKIWPPAGAPLVRTDEESDLISAVRGHFGKAQMVAIGKGLGDRGKLLGLEPEEVCNLAASGVAKVVLCEADGAGGKPLKWHKPGEPVVPACANLVLSIAGLDALGTPVSEVHRSELFAEALGMDRSEAVGPVEIARAMKATERYAPEGSRLIYVLNKADNDEELSKAREVIALMRELGAAEPAICSHRGQVVKVFPADAAVGFKS